MLTFQKKRRVQNLIYSKAVLVVLIIFLFIFAKATYSFYGKASESKARKERAEAEIQELTQRKSDLEGQIERLDSSVGIEEELRNRFDLVKEGEESILIVDSKQEAEVQVEDNSGFWSKLFGGDEKENETQSE